MLAVLLFSLAALAAPTGKPPVVSEADTWAAAEVARQGDATPVARLNLILAARTLSPAAQFALAGTHPGIVEHLIDPQLGLAVALIAALPAPELHRARRGETVIRTDDILRGPELDAAVALAKTLGFPNFDPEKFEAVRIGPLENRFIRVEVSYREKKKLVAIKNLELAWPSTPARDEESRSALTKHFGARPSSAGGINQSLPLQDGSFEQDGALGGIWSIVDGIALGTTSPVADITIDESSALDGNRSLRFYASDKTRLFPEVVQQVAIAGGQKVRARAQLKADKLRVEFQQREDLTGISLRFFDERGMPLGPAVRTAGRLSSHPWENVEIEAVAPPGAALAQVGLMSTVSGTAWFDGVRVEVVP